MTLLAYIFATSSIIGLIYLRLAKPYPLLYLKFSENETLACNLKTGHSELITDILTIDDMKKISTKEKPIDTSIYSESEYNIMAKDGAIFIDSVLSKSKISMIIKSLMPMPLFFYVQ